MIAVNTINDTTGHQPDTGTGDQGQCRVGPAWHARHGQDHADERAKHNQLHHARLGQLVELMDARTLGRGDGSGRHGVLRVCFDGKREV